MTVVDTDDDALFITRRNSFAMIYFKYHEVGGSGEFEYTPCTEKQLVPVAADA
jgi:hypothetical protein